MSAKRSRNTMSKRREESKGERWSTKVYKDLLELGLGRQPCCKQHLCSKMKERLDQHRLNCPGTKLQREEKGTDYKSPEKPRREKGLPASYHYPASLRSAVYTYSPGKPFFPGVCIKDTVDQTSSTVKNANLSIGVATSRNSPPTRKSKIDSAQTNLTFADFNLIDKRDHYEVQSAQTNLTFTDDLNLMFNKKPSAPTEKEDNRSQDNIPIKLTERHEDSHHRVEDIIPVKSTDTQILPGRNLYRDQLNKEIQEFFYDIPVFPNTSEMVKLKRLNVIHHFVYKIADLFVFISDQDYNDKVQREIDECLRNLPMWQPQSEQDKKEFTNRLGASLFKFIKTFNEKWDYFNKHEGYLEKNTMGFVSHDNYGNYDFEKEITNWVETNVQNSNKKDFVINTLIKKIKPILKSRKSEKHLIKAEIVHILEGLSPCFDFSNNKNLCVNILASDLTNLLSDSREKNTEIDIISNKFKRDTTGNNAEWRDKIENETISQITEILFSNEDFASHPNRRDIIKDIRRVLKSSAEFTDSEASSLTKTLVTNLRDFFHEDFYGKMENPSHSSSFLVLTSEHDLSTSSGPKFHSTLTTDVRRKEISKLNKAEKLFIDKVSSIIRTWLDTTDLTFDTLEDHGFKETIVDDMTNDVRSVIKQSIQSQEPRPKIDERLLNMAILKGILKYELFTTPLTEESPQVVDLRDRIMALNNDGILNTSALLEPRHGNRQAMANAKFSKINDEEYRYEHVYQPNALDVLEDNISDWMNEQPSKIYNNNDKPTINRLLREVATSVQDKMVNKMPEDEIKNELKQWLSQIVKPQIKNVDGLAENLKDKIVKLHQDETLTRAHQKRLNDAPVKFSQEQHSYKYEADEKLNEYIDKYMQHNYNIDDDVINGVLKLMVKHELYKLSPSEREELYNNDINDEFNTDKFRMELEIVQQVYDWLKDIPFYYQTLKPGSEVIEFVHCLARNIFDIETERMNYPDRINYETWLQTEIATYMLQKEAAITNIEDKMKIDHCATQLCLRILNIRKRAAGPSDELYNIVTNHMKKYDSLLSKDYLKKILWHRRLADNVKKMLLGKPTASRADVVNALEMTPFPQDESVFKYKMEIKYNIKIHDWLHTLPLVPVRSDEEDVVRKNLIQELLQKVMETDQKKVENPHDSQADDDLDNYLAHWISQLPLETVNVNVQPLISQLRSGLEYVKWAEIQPQRPPEVHGQSISRSRRHSRTHHSKQKDPGEQMVEAIEDWCNKLPIKEDNEEATKATKEQVATNIFQIVGSHIDDPRVADDNQKLRNILDDEIEVQLENLSEHNAIKENKDSLKAALLDNVMEIKNTIRDITAGDDYVHALESSIDESLANTRPRYSNKNDPGYELFKKRMVMLWLLENYDYAVDFHSLKYKKILSEENRSLSEELQKRNLFPADKDEMMNDIQSAFYNAKPPSEDAIIDEIEIIKLRCEIEVWSNELPLKEAGNYSTLLERDQILTILTKVLFDIERSEEPDADEKMRLEIIKWASKLPLISGEKNNMPRYADLLMCFLKASANSRQCQRQPEPKNLTVVEETLSKLKSGEDLGVPKANQESTSQGAGPSASVNYNDKGVSGEQLAFLITQAINNWCIQLPLQFGSADEQNAVQRTKENISQILLNFVSELHYRPNTLRNEGLYEYYLNNQLEAILTQLTNERMYWEAQRGRNDRKAQLINALKAIRPLIQDVKEQENYKEQLKHTISSFHESMAPHGGVELSKNTQLAILDDFIQYKNHKGDFEGQELYQLKINDALNNELNENNNIDPLIAANRLICELSKVESPKQRDIIALSGRKNSQPNPLQGIDRLPSVPAFRRRSLPYPLTHNSCPRFAPTQNFPPQNQRPQHNMSYPGPASQTLHRSTPPLSISLPPRMASPRFSHVPRTPPTPEQIHTPFISPFQRVQRWPGPPPPEFNVSDVSSERHRQLVRREPQVQVHHRQTESQPGLVEPAFVEPSGEREPQVEQQSVPLGAGAGSRTTARARNSPRSLTECPEEDRVRMRRHPSEQEYCETCDREDDCAHNIPPYPTPDYMYY